jgi:hypothetical protein
MRFVAERMTTAEPIVVFLKRRWSFPLALMLLVDPAATAFAGLNVLENGLVIAGIAKEQEVAMPATLKERPRGAPVTKIRNTGSCFSARGLTLIGVGVTI